MKIAQKPSVDPGERFIFQFGYYATMGRIDFKLPKYEAAINKLRDEILFGFHMLDEILKLFPVREVVHRGTTRLVSKPTVLDRSTIPSKCRANIEEIMFLQTDIVRWIEFTYWLTTGLLDQHRQHTIEVMFETGEAAGNNFNSQNEDVWEAYIELLGRLNHRFEGFKFFMGSDVSAKMLATPPTEDQLERAKAVVTEKREEFLATRRTRRLV